MHLKSLSLLLITFLILSCSGSKNSPEFIKKTTGRYLFNPDNIIEVYYQGNELYLKWNGAHKIKPMKTDEITFFVKEMNEKIQFLTNPSDAKLYISLVSKKENETIGYNYPKLLESEKIPSEYFKDKEYIKATQAYLMIQKEDSLQIAINENKFNNLGYSYVKKKEYKTAIEVFKINVALYPSSSNVYDSLGEAYLLNKDTIASRYNYKKSIELDSGNKSAKQLLKKLQNKK